MKKILTISLLTLSTTVNFALVASASVIAEGQVTNGFYWQLVARKNGTMMWLCRSSYDNRFQKHNSCQVAGAIKPSH